MIESIWNCIHMKMNHKILWGSAKQVFREKFLTLKTLLEETGLLERSKFSRYVFAKEQNKSKAGRNRDVQQYSVKKIFFFFCYTSLLVGTSQMAQWSRTHLPKQETQDT